MTRGKYPRYAVVYRGIGYHEGRGFQVTVSKHVNKASALRAAKQNGPRHQVHKIAGR